MSIRYLSCWCVLWGLVSCATVPLDRFSRGDRFTLQQAVPFAPGAYTSTIQAGQLVYAPDPFKPYCKLRLRQAFAEGGEVKPGAWTVHSGQYVIDPIAGIDWPQWQWASLEPIDPADGPGLVTYATRLRLVDGPLYEVFCGRLEDYSSRLDHYLKPAQIAEALGNYGQIVSQ